MTLMRRVLNPLAAAGCVLAISGVAPPLLASGFNSTVQLQGIRFVVQSRDQGAGQQLTITTTGTQRPIPVIQQQVDGSVVGAEVADLNADGQPEILVFVQKSGSGRHGLLVGYALNNGRSLTPITLPALSKALAQGYRGHDSFAVVERCLARRFPLDRPGGDSGASSAVVYRQICYKLEAGEAGWMLRPVSVATF
jgi:hypothetical protein